MGQDEITEGNKLIAEFMGGKIMPHGNSKPYPKGLPNWAMKEYDFDTLKVGGFDYHSSWDWLMAVVEKIEKMGYDSRIHVIDSESSYFIDFVDVVNGNTEAACISKSYHEASKIETVWLAVVEFIKAEIQNVSPLVD